MERYEIRVAGAVSPRRAALLCCRLELLPCGDSLLTFDAIDQASLYGLLSQLRDAGLDLLSVDRQAAPHTLTESEKEMGHDH